MTNETVNKTPSEPAKSYTFAVSLKKRHLSFLLLATFLLLMFFFLVGLLFGLKTTPPSAAEDKTQPPVVELEPLTPGQFPLDGNNELELTLNEESSLSFETPLSSKALLRKDQQAANANRAVGRRATLKAPTTKKPIGRTTRQNTRKTEATASAKKVARPKSVKAPKKVVKEALIPKPRARSAASSLSSTAPPLRANQTYYYLQLLATANREKAQKLKKALSTRGYPVTVKVNRPSERWQPVLYVLRVGLYQTKQTALKRLDELRELGYPEAYLRIYRK